MILAYFLVWFIGLAPSRYVEPGSICATKKGDRERVIPDRGELGFQLGAHALCVCLLWWIADCRRRWRFAWVPLSIGRDSRYTCLQTGYHFHKRRLAATGVIAPELEISFALIPLDCFISSVNFSLLVLVVFIA
jgi:hypothetical protein